MATINLVGKVTRTPDMTAVHNKIAMISADLSQNVNGQTQEIQNIKDELKNLTTNVRKGMAASEAATVAAKEAAEVGKTVAGMARDIKNNGKYNVHNAYTAPSPAPVQREIILKSGDLSIRTTTNSEMQTLRQFTDDWVPRLGNGTSPPQKAMSSIVIEFTKPEDANRIIDENLVWQCEMCPAERYERQCRLKQCFQCQKYGHIGTQCKAAKTCGYCAQEHSYWECPTKTNLEAARKCVICHGTHEAWSRECPTRKEEVAKIKAILATRPKYHTRL
ncbi:uncharacterized protein PV09_09855 [Verruconis gallopava]|uniref:CCHC-type domain-containing protein n=1 Tax=Verruconis gallopava TaxID=253628 RepID=A0A0D2AH82_9PEZI|nr:uncharacterized protein PV09_09855 [Verruconis gallopava]KIV98298.1 hypothetical protein PV09_09855 [Verruconis gallopava]